MAIGDPITQTIPSVGTLGTGYATSINAFLSEVKTRLESKVAFSSLLASGTLDLLGQPLANARYVGFAEQSVSPAGAPTGRYEYFDGEFYAVTAAGVVQITSGGALAVTSAGGIGGDYGGANPAEVRFSDADERYDFYDDFGSLEWGYVRALGFDIAAGVTSSFFARLLYAGAGSLTYTLPATLPGAGRALVMLSNTGQLDHNRAASQVTADAFFDANLNLAVGRSIFITGAGSKTATLTGNDLTVDDGSNFTSLDPNTGVHIAGGDIHISTARRYTVVPKGTRITGTVTPVDGGMNLAASSSADVEVWMMVGDRITQVEVNALVSSGTANITVEAFLVGLGTRASIGSIVESVGTTAETIILNVTDTTLAAAQAIEIRVTSAATAVTYSIGVVNVVHTRP